MRLTNRRYMVWELSKPTYHSLCISLISIVRILPCALRLVSFSKYENSSSSLASEYAHHNLTCEGVHN